MSLRRTSQQLSDLAPGQRAWFWFCPQLASDPLLIAPLDEDPGMKKLRATIARLEQPAGARPIFGLLSMGEDGQMDVGSPQLTRRHFAALAQWVSANAAAYPELGVLKDARARLLGPQFQVLKTLEDPSLWEGVGAVVVNGTNAAAAMVLSRLAVGQRAWFWATLDGPEHQPFLAVSEADSDPDVEDLNYQVRLLARRSGWVSKSLQGVIVRQADGSLLLHSSAKARRLQAVLTGLKQAHEETLPVLRQLTNTPLADDGPDLSAVSAALGRDDALFWFHRGSDGVTLVLAEDRAALRDATKATGLAGGESVKGHLLRSPKGWLEFRASRDLDAFLPDLARWATAHAPRWPALRTLRGARLTVRDSEDNITARYRDESLWTEL
ncbi:MAG: hypothetical protein ACI8RZ_003027 [Myxococcota bacterium]|jgi:hypothetical protein